MISNDDPCAMEWYFATGEIRRHVVDRLDASINDLEITTKKRRAEILAIRELLDQLSLQLNIDSERVKYQLYGTRKYQKYTPLISYPTSWPKPSYTFGQRVAIRKLDRLGIIIGLEYYDGKNDYQMLGWLYTVQFENLDPTTEFCDDYWEEELKRLGTVADSVAIVASADNA